MPEEPRILFTNEMDELCSHTSSVEQKNQSFLRSVTLLENNLQHFLALDPKLATAALAGRKEGVEDYLERAISTRDRINELLGLFASEREDGSKWIVPLLARGIRGEPTQTMRVFIGSLAQCRNAIWALITEREGRLPNLKNQIPSVNELGGRLLGIKKGLVTTLRPLLKTIDPRSASAVTLRQALLDARLEMQENRFPFETRRKSNPIPAPTEIIKAARPHAKPKTSLTSKPPTTPSKKKKGGWTWGNVEPPTEKEEGPGAAEKLMSTFVPAPPVLKLNPDFADLYPWLENEDIYPIEKNETNADGYLHFQHSFRITNEERIVAIERKGGFRPMIILKAALIDPAEIARKQQEQDEKDDALIDWDQLEAAELEDLRPEPIASEKPQPKRLELKPKRRFR